VRLVDGGQQAGQVLTLVPAHPPQLGFVYHAFY
jgi:hypothetical protein